jgi:hypothetical protein
VGHSQSPPFTPDDLSQRFVPLLPISPLLLPPNI